METCDYRQCPSRDTFEQGSPCRQVNRPGAGTELGFGSLVVVEVDSVCRGWHRRVGGELAAVTKYASGEYRVCVGGSTAAVWRGLLWRCVCALLWPGRMRMNIPGGSGGA